MDRRSLVLATLGPAETRLARAQSEFPSKPLTIIVPQPPGGGFDFVARRSVRAAGCALLCTPSNAFALPSVA